MESDLQALEETGFLHMFSHYCESAVKTFGPLRTYYPPLERTQREGPEPQEAILLAQLRGPIRFSRQTFTV